MATISDAFFQTPAALAAGEDAANVHVRALLWCSANLTDGAIPTGALDLLTRRPDAAQLAVALVAAGLWSQTATGWQVVDYLAAHPSRASVLKARGEVSAAKAAAGRLGGLRTAAARAARSTGPAATQQTPSSPPAETQQVPADPRTVHASAPASESGTSGTESGGNEERTTTVVTATTATTAAPDPVVAMAMAPASLPAPTPAPDGDALLARIAKASAGRFVPFAGKPRVRAALLDALAAFPMNGAIADRMGLLLRNTQKLWPWATRVHHGTITCAALLGSADAHGERSAALLTSLVGLATEQLLVEQAAKARADREAAQRAEAAEAARLRREAEGPPMTPEERTAKVREIQRQLRGSLPAQGVAA